MNFFEHQAAARRNTRRLVLLFGLAVITIVLTIDAALLFALAANTPSDEVSPSLFGLLAAHAEPLAAASVATVLVIGIASLIRIGTLRAGGVAVAQSLGAARVAEDTRDPQLRRLRNVVEEIAIASCTPVPAIFVLEEEQAINAFAAGYSPNDAAIAVTRGALERLNRDELQGVVAHEFSHILNGDTRLNIHLMGVLFGILVLGIIGRRILIHGRGGRDSKNAGAVLAVAVTLMIVGYAGVFFGRLIKAGVSRSREFLADASAVQFTRQTSGIAGALKKIGGLDEGSRLLSADTEEVSHMLFGDGVGYSALWATHPPLLDRIKALEPAFDAKQLKGLQRQWRQAPPSGLAEDRALGFSDGHQDAPPPLRPSSLPEALALAPNSLPAATGQLGHASIQQAGRIHEQLPPALLQAAHAHDDAMPLVLALLLEVGDDAARQRQLQAIRAAFAEETVNRTLALQPPLIELHPLLRLPLAALAFPALRRRPRPQLERFIGLTEQLIHADGQRGLFEYCLGRLLQRQVIEALDPSRHRGSGRRKLAQCRNEMVDLFALLAAQGHTDQAEARRAFAAGLHVVLPGVAIDYRPPGDWSAALDRALDALDRLDPFGKQLLVEGLAACCAHDGRVTVAEAELLRTVCACLHCPLPPLLGQG